MISFFSSRVTIVTIYCMLFGNIDILPSFYNRVVTSSHVSFSQRGPPYLCSQWWKVTESKYFVAVLFFFQFFFSEVRPLLAGPEVLLVLKPAFFFFLQKCVCFYFSQYYYFFMYIF